MLDRLGSAPDAARAAALEAIAEAAANELAALATFWPLWARSDQLPPPGAWRTWLLLGGRGAGKTRAGAEWVRGEVESGRLGRIALVGPAFSDVREVMIDGPSGLRAIGGGGWRPKYEPSRRRLVWPNGAIGFAFSAEDPDALRGPQFDGAWLDEFAAWRDAQAAYDVLQFGLRLGRAPRQMVTTTPRPIAPLRRLLSAKGAVVTRAATAANAANLAPGFVEVLRAAYARSPLARQELDGELIEDLPGALWSRELIERAIRPPPETLDRIVVGVDPPAGEGETADACGVVVAGAVGHGVARRAWVLADLSVRGATPRAWATRVVAAADEFEADCIVAEVNQGGAMVRALLQVVDPTAAVQEVHATRGKRVRAEPISLLYESGRIFHAGRFAALEDEMCAFGGAGFGSGSPDRVDALVWALTALMREENAPRLRRM